MQPRRGSHGWNRRFSTVLRWEASLMAFFQLRPFRRQSMCPPSVCLVGMWPSSPVAKAPWASEALVAGGLGGEGSFLSCHTCELLSWSHRGGLCSPPAHVRYIGGTDAAHVLRPWLSDCSAFLAIGLSEWASISVCVLGTVLSLNQHSGGCHGALS